MGGGADVSGSHMALPLFSATFVCRRRPTASPGSLVLDGAGDVGGERCRCMFSIRCPPACSAVSRCDTRSLISTWVMTCLTLQGRHFCSLSVTGCHSRRSFIFICDRIEPVPRLGEVGRASSTFISGISYPGDISKSLSLCSVLHKLPVFHALSSTFICDPFNILSERGKIGKFRFLSSDIDIGYQIPVKKSGYRIILNYTTLTHYKISNESMQSGYPR